MSGRTLLISLALLLSSPAFPLSGSGDVALAQTPSQVSARSTSNQEDPGRLPVLRTGEKAPSLDGVLWLQGNHPVEPASFDGITVVEFWATWCPVSRLVLDAQNRRLVQDGQNSQPALDRQNSHLALDGQDGLPATGQGQGLQILAVSPEDPATVREFLKTAGWDHIIVGVDPSRQVLDRWFEAATLGQERTRSFPFGFIVGPGLQGSRGTVLWMDPVRETFADYPLEKYESALATVRAGSFDLPAAMALEERIQSYSTLREQADQAYQDGDMARLIRILRRLRPVPLPRSRMGVVEMQMNAMAWDLATADNPTPQALEAAAEAVALALECGGDRSWGVVDTQARVLWEQGRREEACRVEAQALAVARTPADSAEAAGILVGYLREMDRPVDSRLVAMAEGESRASDASGPWMGNLNEAHALVRPEDRVLVRPEVQADTAAQGRWTRELAKVRKNFHQGAPLLYPDEVTEEQKKTKRLLLYGTPASNPLIAEVLQKWNIALRPDGIESCGRFIPVEHPVLLAALPNPWNPAMPLSVYAAPREEDAHTPNRFYHGPTSVVIGHWMDGKPEVVLSLNHEAHVVKGEGRPNGAGDLQVCLSLPPERLTSEQCVEDLRALGGQLRSRYAGYADLDWDLSRRGSSWEERTEEYARRLYTRPSWEWTDVFDLLLEYLEPVQDVHFVMAGTGPVDGAYSRKAERLAENWSPYFTGVRLVGDGAGYRVAEVEFEEGGVEEKDPGLIGAFVEGVEIIQSPHVVEAGKPYLFPTLPAAAMGRSGYAGSPDPAGLSRRTPDSRHRWGRSTAILREGNGNTRSEATEFLLGVLSPETEPPSAVEVRFRGGAGGRSGGAGDFLRAIDSRRARTVRLPLHRGRAALSDAGTDPWTLTWPPETPLPVLGVRTMVEKRLDGMVETADTLRACDAFVLDLRRNGGGSDTPAMKWCHRLSSEHLDWIAVAYPWPGEEDPLRRWVTRVVGREGFRVNMPPSHPAADEPYDGRLWVLVDKGVASSGETFIHLAGQMDGAVVLGENTAGCASYGNVTAQTSLPNSNIQVAFGVTRFVVDWVRPNKEGVGFFPDYWMDQEDLVRVAAEAAVR